MLTHHINERFKEIGEELEGHGECLDMALVIMTNLLEKCTILEFKLADLESKHESLKARVDKVYH